MKETTNYKLKKPDGTDFVGPNPFNENADIIDEKLKSIEDGKADGNHNHDSSYYGKENLDTKFQNVNDSLTRKGNCNARFLQGETIPVDAWVATTSEYLPESMWDQFLADYPFMADLVVAGVDDTWKADVLPDMTGHAILSSVNMTFAGKIRFYAKEKPEASILLLNVELRKAVT